MPNFRFPSLRAATVAALLVVGAGHAHAQGLNQMMQQNMAFDAQMNAQLQQAMAANQAAMQRMQQAYMQQFGPMLREQYVKSGANQQMTFEQYAYWMMMTANGTNTQAALAAQQQQFAAQQHAHDTVMQGYNGYNQAMEHNSQVQQQAVEAWTHGAIRGEAQYANPQTGAPQWMPYYAPGQVQTYGGYNYVQAPNGTYWQQQGNTWVQVNPTGR